MQKEIESKISETIDENFSGEFCQNCGHSIDEHETRLSGSNKCFGLDNDGCWKACSCQKFKNDFALVI